MAEDDSLDFGKAQQELRDAANAIKRMAGLPAEPTPPYEKSNRGGPYCSFCGKSKNEVQVLIAGPSVHICNECITACQKIIEEQKPGG